MKVLAIDPGYGRCGLAIIERNSGRDSLIYSSCVETKATDEFTKRLTEVTLECERLITIYEPEAFAIEKLFFSANRKTAMRVAEVRGALIQCAASHGLEIFEYSPAEVKSAIASSGRADKQQLASMLHLLIKIDKKVELDDEYDAIAIGVTHFAIARVRA